MWFYFMIWFCGLFRYGKLVFYFMWLREKFKDIDVLVVIVSLFM